MSTHNVWTHKGTFLLAAVGSAVGLGNLWRFPYLAGENGGGAFILVYVLTIFAVGIPILIAESMLGRASRRSPIMGMRFLTRTHHTSRSWETIGWLGGISAFLILSFYSVIAGWAIHYTWQMLTGTLAGADAETIAAGFDALLASPSLLTLYHTLFIIASGLIVGLGVHQGIDRGLRVIMPALFVILLVVLAYGVTNGDFAEMPGGALIGGIFFILVLGAAISSSISLIEPVAAFLVERFDLTRPQAVFVMVMATWALGLLTVVSFNLWAEASLFHSLFGRSAFDLFELLTNIFMPLGGLLIALFAGWSLTHSEVMKEMRTNETWFAIWRFLVRFIAPAAVSFVFLRAIPQVDGYLIPAIGAVVIVGAFAAGRTFLMDDTQEQ